MRPRITLGSMLLTVVIGAGCSEDSSGDGSAGEGGTAAESSGGSSGAGSGGTSATGGAAGTSATGGAAGTSGGGAGNGGSSAGAGGSAVGGSGGAPHGGGTGGASTGGAGGGIACGSDTCNLTSEYCCDNYNEPDACMATGETCVYGVVVECDGPEDCAGQACCATLFIQGQNRSIESIQCQADCSASDERVVCGASGACPSGKTCSISDLLPPYRDCK